MELGSVVGTWVVSAKSSAWGNHGGAERAGTGAGVTGVLSL